MKDWSDGKLADKIRGTEKPLCASGDEWKEWDLAAKEKHPFRYWLVEVAADKIQEVVSWPIKKLYDIKYYVVNRWIDQSHALVAHPKHIKPGQYQDFDSRILICLFDELVDFVEIEKAYSNYRWDEKKSKELKWWQGGRWRTRTWRSAEAGLEQLKWEADITNEDIPINQVFAAREIIELYTWWTEIYPNRPDPMDASGWAAYCDDKRVRGIGFMETDPEEYKWNVAAMHDKMRELEAQYDAEDTGMLIRLIKIRGHLWT